MNNNNNNEFELLDILTILSFYMQLKNINLDMVFNDKIMSYITKESDKIVIQNEIIIAQNEEILKLLKKEAINNAQKNDKRNN